MDVVLAEPVDFAADEVRMIQLLREEISHGRRVDWSMATPPHTDPTLLCHLPPPREAEPVAAAAARVWRERFGYGLCYYRKGPGFVTIRDTRDSSIAARFLLDEELAVTAFACLEEVVHLPTAAGPTMELLELLEGERLAVRCGEWGTLLPSRMRVWPVPFNAV